MIKKTITYTDYDGNVRTEDFHFNLTKAELVDFELDQAGGLQKVIEKITKEQDTRRLKDLFKEIILRAYGQKSMDGRRFIKTPELTKEFTETEAYSQLFMECATDANAAAAFINGIIPNDMQASAESIKEAINA